MTTPDRPLGILEVKRAKQAEEPEPRSSWEEQFLQTLHFRGQSDEEREALRRRVLNLSPLALVQLPDSMMRAKTAGEVTAEVLDSLDGRTNGHSIAKKE